MPDALMLSLWGSLLRWWNAGRVEHYDPLPHIRSPAAPIVTQLLNDVALWQSCKVRIFGTACSHGARGMLLMPA
jgi:hypothetical protein